MPLTKDTLKVNLIQAFNDNTNDRNQGSVLPNMPQASADRLAMAYHSWIESSSPIAGGVLSIIVPGQMPVLSSLLVTPLFSGWGPGLIAYWTPVVWAGPGFIPSNPTLPTALSGVGPEMLNLVSSSHPKTIDESADRLATILNKYTAQLQVIATTPTGVVSIVPVV